MKKIIVLLLIFIFPIIVLAYKPGDTYINGDADSNGKVTSIDYIVVRKHILKQTTLSGDAFTRADVTGDKKITSLDYIAIRKMILNGNTHQAITVPSQPTSTPQPQVTVTFIGEKIINTGYEEKDVLIKGGKVSEHRSSKLSLKENTKYYISFDYQTKSGTNKFNVDLYPDTLPEKTFFATTKKQHYDWNISSNKSDISNCYIRFFDDRRSTNESDILISNIVLSMQVKRIYDVGDTLGTLPTPVRKGHEFMGWYNSDGVKVTAKTKITDNMILYAKWKENIDLVLMWGQSNMVGYNNETLNNTNFLRNIDSDIVNNNQSYSRVLVDLPSDVAYEYKALSNKLFDISSNPKTFGEKAYYNNKKIVSSGNSIYYIEESRGTNMIPYFAKEYYERTGHKIVIVFAGRGGMDIEKFLPNSTTNLYKLISNKYLMAKEYLENNNYNIVNKFYVVYQGEYNAVDGKANSYKSNYEIVHNSLIKDLNLSFGAMVYIVRGDKKITDNYIQIVRNAQVDLVGKYNNLIKGTDYPYNELAKGNTSILCPTGNIIHLNAAGLSQIGRDIAKNIALSGKIK